MGVVVDDARGKPPIAQALDRDLGIFTRNLSDARAACHAPCDAKPQRFGSSLRIGRNGYINEIAHTNQPVLHSLILRVGTGPRWIRVRPDARPTRVPGYIDGRA
jgi:hypothetical protein